MVFSLLTGTEVHLDATTQAYTSVSHHSRDVQSSHSPEVHGQESKKPYDYSGHIPPAEVAVVSEELGSSVDTPVVDGDGVTLLTQTFVSVTPPTPSLEAELSSSEIITLVPDSVASPEAATQEDLQEGDSILSTIHSDMNKRERDAGEGSGGSSGESEEEATSRILSAAYHPEDQDVTTTLIPHQTLTADWDPESSFDSSSTSSSSPSVSLLSSPYTTSPSSALGGFQPDEESRAEPRSTEGSDHMSKERQAEITTRSIRSCELGRYVRKLHHFFQFGFSSSYICFLSNLRKP